MGEAAAVCEAAALAALAHWADARSPVILLAC